MNPPAGRRPSPRRKARAAAPPGAPKAPEPVKAKAVVDPWIGKVLARCRVLEQIGLGRTAVVYRAHHESLHQDVAIKVLLPEAAAIPDLVKRFRDEGRWIAQIDNENVLKIYDVGVEDERPFMVVELLEGEEIYDLVQREGPLEVTDALRIVRQAAAGLAAVHGRGVVHRDIKPQNLFLLEDGTVKVVDFGLAAEHDAPKERVGTPHFMAPETCRDGSFGPASDIYGLGITLYHLLVGQPPFGGKSVKEILQAHIDAAPLRPERERSEVTSAVGDLVRDLTQKDPAARPEADAIVRRLDEMGGEALLEKGTLRSSRTRRRARSRVAVARRERQAAGAGSGGRIVGIVIGVGVLVGAIALLSSGGDAPVPPPAGTGGGAGSATAGAGATHEHNPTDPAVLAAREAAEREAAARVEAARQEAEADEALQRAEQFARDTWHGPSDTAAVIARYKGVASKYKGLAAGDRAKERAKAIEDETAHPHPDRAWTSADEVERIRGLWKERRPEIEELVRQGEFRKALDVLPAEVQDAAGSLASDLRFWRGHVSRLIAFRRRLLEIVGRRHPTAPPLTIEIDGEERVVARMLDDGIEIREGLKTERLPWAKVPGAEVARLAESLFPPQDAQALLEQMAYALSQRLEDAFWTRELDLGSHAKASEFAALRMDYKARWEAGN